jgi:hypothetical protein
MKFKTFTISIILLLPTGIIIGQQILPAILPDTTTSFTNPFFFADPVIHGNEMATSFDFKSMRPNSIMPAYKVTGIFCRMEHRIEATSNFAPRFRLGSVNYTDWMEGKKPFLSRFAK